MKEEEMFEPMIKYLEDNGYKIKEQHRGREGGPDIVAEKNGRELVIQMKGYTANLSVDFGTCIGQLLRYIKSEDSDYGMAFPLSYLRFVKDSEYPIKKLGIRVFIVSRKDVVRLW